MGVFLVSGNESTVYFPLASVYELDSLTLLA